MGDYECKVEWGGEPAPVKTVNLEISPVSSDKSENFPAFFFYRSFKSTTVNVLKKASRSILCSKSTSSMRSSSLNF